MKASVNALSAPVAVNVPFSLFAAVVCSMLFAANEYPVSTSTVFVVVSAALVPNPAGTVEMLLPLAAFGFQPRNSPAVGMPNDDN